MSHSEKWNSAKRVRKVHPLENQKWGDLGYRRVGKTYRKRRYLN